VPDSIEVQGDPDRLLQVLWNLLANAVKFTPKGGTVSVSATSTEAVRISVADTGVGIAAGELPFVFHRFWQGEPGARTQSGLGLGLALVKHIIELHGGSVSVSSAGPGLGSRFDIELPKIK
jgi:signal transduction histidine kinase